MPRTRWTLFAVAVLLAGCDAADPPTDPSRTSAVLPSAVLQEKIGADVLAALDRGESPAIVVSLDVPGQLELPALRPGLEPEDARAPGRRVQDAREHLDGRRLAGAVRTDERQPLPRLDPEAQSVDGEQRAASATAAGLELLRQTVDLDRRHAP